MSDHRHILVDLSLCCCCCCCCNVVVVVDDDDDADIVDASYYALQQDVFWMKKLLLTQSLFFTESGEVFTWGKGKSGRLGHGDTRGR